MSVLVCASPSCAARIGLAPVLAANLDGRLARRVLAHSGWAVRVDGEGQAEGWCPRCVAEH